MRSIDEIIIHCSATKEGQNFHASDIDQWHKAKGWNGIGYHFVVDLDGKVEVGRDINKAGAHCSGRNSHSIGICYIGGIDANNKAKDTRTDAQRKSLRELVDKLKAEYKIDKVFGHNKYNAHKACPCFKVPEEL